MSQESPSEKKCFNMVASFITYLTNVYSTLPYRMSRHVAIKEPLDTKVCTEQNVKKCTYVGTYYKICSAPVLLHQGTLGKYLSQVLR